VRAEVDPGGPARPYPAPVAAAFADFFAGLARHELVVRRCYACGAVQWPPRVLCARCHGDEFQPAALPDRGVVHTFTVCYRAFDPWFAARVPYAIAVVEISAGIRLTGNYLAADPADLADLADLAGLSCGLPVRARYQEENGRVFLGWVPDTEDRP
jgi:uncharacterized protein